MISISIDSRQLKNLKISQRDVNAWYSKGFRKLMDTLTAFSKVSHTWKNRTGTTSSNTKRQINRNGTSGKIYNNTDVAKFLYYGTTKHFVEPTRKSALSWATGGVRYFSKGHWVSGIKADPWIEKNYKSRQQRFKAMIEKSAIEGMTRKWS